MEQNIWWFRYFIFAYFGISIFVIANLFIAVIVENVFVIARDYDFEQGLIKEEARRVSFEELKDDSNLVAPTLLLCGFLLHLSSITRPFTMDRTFLHLMSFSRKPQRKPKDMNDRTEIVRRLTDTVRFCFCRSGTVQERSRRFL